MSIALQLLGMGLVIAVALMALLWLIQLRTHNAGIVDVGWALGAALIAVAYAALGPGYLPRRELAAAMAVVWGLRLAGYLYVTRVAGAKEEEGRYRQLREEWKTNLPLKFLAFFEFQALLDVVFSLPVLMMVLNPEPALGALEGLGAAVWLAGVAGESLADWQLHAFKRDPAHRGQLCQAGLWNYSRHPNYFFEWLVWVGFALAALASPMGWVALVCPALMLFFLFKLTGIPATEAQALRSKGDAYREYQRTTSAFVPWFKRA